MLTSVSPSPPSPLLLFLACCASSVCFVRGLGPGPRDLGPRGWFGSVDYIYTWDFFCKSQVLISALYCVGWVH